MDDTEHENICIMNGGHRTLILPTTSRLATGAPIASLRRKHESSHLNTFRNDRSIGCYTQWILFLEFRLNSKACRNISTNLLNCFYFG